MTSPAATSASKASVRSPGPKVGVDEQIEASDSAHAEEIGHEHGRTGLGHDQEDLIARQDLGPGRRRLGQHGAVRFAGGGVEADVELQAAG